MKKRVFLILLTIVALLACTSCKDNQTELPTNENIYEETYILNDVMYEKVQGYIVKKIANKPIAIIPDTYNNLPVLGIAAEVFEFSLITDITIGANISALDNGTFRNCGLLKSVSLGKGIRSIGALAFEGCGVLEKITVDSDNPYLSSEGLIVMDKSGSKIEFVPKTIAGKITLPQSILQISDNAFSACQNLTEITIGAKVTIVGKNAFLGCYNLERINFGAAISLTTIDDSAFYDCRKLKTLIFPIQLENVNDQSFARCESLQTVSFGGKIKHIALTAFNDCVSVRTYTVTKNEYVDGENGIIYNAKKTDILLVPTALEGEVTLPYSLTRIAALAFKDCEKLTGVVVGTNVLEIGSGAFLGCDALEKIKLNCSVVPNIHTNSIAVKKSLKVIVPQALLLQYKSEITWASFKDYIFAS